MSKSSHYLNSFLKNLTLQTPLAIIIGSILISLSIILQGYIIRGKIPQTATNQTFFQGRPIDTTDHIEGNTASGVVVVEYSDPECPYCIQLHPTMKKLRTDYGDKIAFVYRTFPLTQIHPHAYDESRAITCAGIVGGTKGFYTYIDSLFGYKVSNKTTELPTTGKEDIAKGSNLDIQKFKDCMQSTTPGELVDASTNDGITAGVSGTPTTFILRKKNNTYEVVAMVSGAQSYSYFKAAIDQALSK